jgi:hypothetical protein
MYDVFTIPSRTQVQVELHTDHTPCTSQTWTYVLGRRSAYKLRTTHHSNLAVRPRYWWACGCDTNAAPGMGHASTVCTPTTRSKQRALGEHSGNIWGTFGEHLGNIWGLFREHLRNIRGTCGDCDLMHTHGIFRERSGNIQGFLSNLHAQWKSFREKQSGDNQGAFKDL